MKNILFFSNNKDKIYEVKNLFKKLKYKIITPKDLDTNFEPKENGKSFVTNSKVKSLYGFKTTGLPCFADDSGICIEALNWKPNIYSKDFINSFKNKNECFKHILKKVKETNKNKAYFITSICLTLEINHHIVFQGKLEGIINERVIGKEGFGYDPLFKPNICSKTLGEMKKEEKNKISHRSIAINKLLSFLSN